MAAELLKSLKDLGYGRARRRLGPVLAAGPDGRQPVLDGAERTDERPHRGRCTGRSTLSDTVAADAVEAPAPPVTASAANSTSRATRAFAIGSLGSWGAKAAGLAALAHHDQRHHHSQVRVGTPPTRTCRYRNRRPMAMHSDRRDGGRRLSSRSGAEANRDRNEHGCEGSDNALRLQAACANATPASVLVSTTMNGGVRQTVSRTKHKSAIPKSEAVVTELTQIGL